MKKSPKVTARPKEILENVCNFAAAFWWLASGWNLVGAGVLRAWPSHGSRTVPPMRFVVRGHGNNFGVARRHFVCVRV